MELNTEEKRVIEFMRAGAKVDMILHKSEHDLTPMEAMDKITEFDKVRRIYHNDLSVFVTNYHSNDTFNITIVSEI